MTDPEKPGEGASSSYSLPSWIDHAIARSKSDDAPATPRDVDAAAGSEAEQTKEEYAEETVGGLPDDPAANVSETAETREYPLPSLPTGTSLARAPEELDTRGMVPSFLADAPASEADHANAAAAAPPEVDVAVMGPDETTAAEAISAPPTIDPRSRERAALPWIIAALFLTAAALVLAYLIWLRPTS